MGMLSKAKKGYAPESQLFGFKGGLQLQPNKRALQNGTDPIAELEAPQELVIPLLDYNKNSIAPQVELNQRVNRGQLIAASIVAPATGQITTIEPRRIIHPETIKANAIVLAVDKASDNQSVHLANQANHDSTAWDTQLSAFLNNPDNVLQQSALYGLGGAGFPTASKLDAALGGIQTLIINAAECEPEIACDEALMQTEATHIARGIDALVQLTQCTHCLLAIEDSMPAAIDAMSAAVKSINAQVKLTVIPTIYPTGAESPLIQTLTGRFIPHNEKPSDHGIVCFNVATAYALYQAIGGKALDSRVVSLGGSAMPNPLNVRVRFGSSVEAVLLATGNASVLNTARLRAGGPLSGFDLDTPQVPITAQTNALLAEPRITDTPAQPCIRCGECSDVCPAKLLPQQLHWYAMSDDHEKCNQLNLNACIECGCCDLVCPASIKLTQSFRYAKSKAKHLALQQQKTLDAEQRFAQHEARVARRKKEKAQAIEQRKQSLKARSKPQSDQIKAALERARLSAKSKKPR